MVRRGMICYGRVRWDKVTAVMIESVPMCCDRVRCDRSEFDQVRLVKADAKRTGKIRCGAVWYGAAR